MITEQRTIYCEDLRNLCIQKQWYTCGTVKDYEELMSFCSERENITTDDLAKIAMDIIQHSSGMTYEDDLEHVCFELERIAVHLFHLK